VVTPTELAQRDLYVRGTATLLASWEEYARGSDGAALMRLDGVSAAVFPNGPERAVYNNALLEPALDRSERTTAIDAMEAAYGSAGIDRFAAWVHESDDEMRAELGGRGYSFAESTRAMGMPLNDQGRVGAEVPIEVLTWEEYLEFLHIDGAPAGLLKGADSGAFHLLGVRRSGGIVSAALAFDWDGDAGIYNMGTLKPARRRGLAAALTARHLEHARGRGCSTASLQATPIAEGVYGDGWLPQPRSVLGVRATPSVFWRVSRISGRGGRLSGPRTSCRRTQTRPGT
jgi:GNAT superfamily N-acetyltransferase